MTADGAALGRLNPAWQWGKLGDLHCEKPKSLGMGLISFPLMMGVKVGYKQEESLKVCLRKVDTPPDPLRPCSQEFFI